MTQLPVFAVLVLLLAPISALGDETALTHLHYAKFSGVLREPYYTIEVEVRLNEENDDVEYFRLVIGGNELQIEQSILDQMKNVELGTLKIEDLIYGDSTDHGSAMRKSDWITIEFEIGERYRISWEENGESRYHWGKDSLHIMIEDGRSIATRVSKLNRYSRSSLSW
jgi:hypothetical protein